MPRYVLFGIALTMAVAIAFGLGWFTREWTNPANRSAPATNDKNDEKDADFPVTIFCEGTLLPAVRSNVCSPLRAKVVSVNVKPGEKIREGDKIAEVYSPQLSRELDDLHTELDRAEQLVRALDVHLTTSPPEQHARIRGQVEAQKAVQQLKQRAFSNLLAMYHADDGLIPGHFFIVAPRLAPARDPGPGKDAPVWTVIDVPELVNRMVDPTEPLIRLGDIDGNWEVELKIPEEHFGSVISGFNGDGPNRELDVSLLLKSDPIHTYRGKLRRDRIALHFDPLERTVTAYVRVNGEDIDLAKRLSAPANKQLLISGTEVHAKIHSTRPRKTDSQAFKPLRVRNPPHAAELRKRGRPWQEEFEMPHLPDYLLCIEVPFGKTWEMCGILDELLVREGQHVEEGEVLAKFNERGVKRMLMAAEAELSKCEANLQERRLDRQKLGDPKPKPVKSNPFGNPDPPWEIDPIDYLETEIAKLVAEKQRDQEQIEFYKEMLEKLIVKSPRKGVVIDPPSIDAVGKEWDQRRPIFCYVADWDLVPAWMWGEKPE